MCFICSICAKKRGGKDGRGVLLLHYPVVVVVVVLVDVVAKHLGVVLASIISRRLVYTIHLHAWA